MPLKMGTRKHPKDFGRNITNIIGNQQSDEDGSYVSLFPKWGNTLLADDIVGYADRYSRRYRWLTPYAFESMWQKLSKHGFLDDLRLVPGWV